MRRQDQILEWVKGNYIHNYEFDECCPDFSCCHADLLASDEEREAFATAYVNGNHGLMNEYLMVFLSKALYSAGQKVYIAWMPIEDVV